MSDHAIPTLLRKRSELAVEIDQRQAALVNMLSDLNALDTAIRLFDPEIDLPEVVMKPLPPRNGAARGQMTMLVLAILRESSEPMQTEEICRQVMVRRGLSPSDKPLWRMMLARTHSCLRAHRKRGRVSFRKAGTGSVWGVAR
jgi:hypothetical protein